MIISKHIMTTLTELSLEKCYNISSEPEQKIVIDSHPIQGKSHNTYHDMCAFKVQPWNKLVQRM